MGNEETKSKFTPQQEAAISHRGSPLLVSSAAGSGKTMVLVERLLSYIDDGHNIDEFLVITYTRAAALELRERIYERLQERLAETPGNFHLRRQPMLCRGANIDTIHAFCATVLRENAHLASLPPDFRVADENECEIIKNEVLEDVFNRTYEANEENGELMTFLNMLVEGRDDSALLEIVQDVYGRLRSVPDPEGWIRRQIENNESKNAITDVSQTVCGRYLMAELRGRVMHCLGKMLMLREKMRLHQDFESRWAASVDETVRGLTALADALEESWDEAVGQAKVAFPTPKPVSGYDELKAVRTWCKAETGKIAKYLDTRSNEHIKDMDDIYPVIATLLKLVLDFDAAYSQEKRKRGFVDFSDLEHMTLSLLVNKETGKRTAIAGAISKRFTEIMIDEYQDVNEVQEMLFNALSQKGDNIFMVGDVKQSIYRFRLAEPSIFLEKYRDFEELELHGAAERAEKCIKSDGNLQKPAKINLSMNFRSKAGILEAVNDVFRNIMSATLGEMEYTDSEALVPGRAEKKGKQGKQGIHSALVEIDLLTTDTMEENDEESPSSEQLEANHVARRIKELIDTPHMIEEKDGSMRQIMYSDIAILLRSIKGISWRYAKALSDMGIACDISNSENYFGAIEVQAALSMLSVIDNPMQDIPLAAVLCGPVYRFTSDEMAQIRIKNKDVNYYEALKRSAEPDIVSDEIACKCKKVLTEIDELRSIAYDYKVDRFILSVYNRTGLLKKVTAMKDGEKRKNNLLALVEFAQNFERNGYRGLFEFLNFIRDLQERGIDIADSPGGNYSAAAVPDAVRILSIHKSKGLEFPVVFLSNTAKRHNTADLNKPFIFHKSLGVGGTLADVERRVKYTTLARSAIREKLRNELLSEELRVLYVAMTRAREKLVITATFGDATKRESKIKLLADASGKFSPYALMSFGSMAEWLLAAASNSLQDSIAVNRYELTGDEDDREDSPEISDDAARESVSDGRKAETAMPAKVFDFKYPYEAATRLPSKLTVTGIKSIASADDPEAEKAQWIRPQSPYMVGHARKPRFISSKQRMTGSERGTAIHEVMRYIDYNKCSDEDDIRNDLERLAERGFLDAGDAAEIDNDINKIATLFKTDLGRRMKESAALSREFRFSLLVPANKYFPDGGDEQILLQGIVDCYFEEEGELVLVDFKSDSVNEDNINERAEKYAPQLNGYAEALERITGKKVKERILYFFATGSAVIV